MLKPVSHHVSISVVYPLPVHVVISYRATAAADDDPESVSLIAIVAPGKP